MIKLSDYVFKFIKEKGIEHVFMLPGGGAMHLVDSLGKSEIEYICCGHEQAVAIAAESYGQHTNDIGVGLVTSGPGATNAITGVTAGWIDSTPMFMISGQAKSSDLIGTSGVRQMGSQEVQIIDMIKPIIKYAVQILEAKEIKYHLEKAYHQATTGRMGPVWLDIPLDIQAVMIDEDKLLGLDEMDKIDEGLLDISNETIKTMDLLSHAKQPLILAGNGVKLANAEEEFHELIEKLQIPVMTTWKSIDLLDEDHPLYAGHPGGMGDRGANYILQSSDLLIILGSRLDPSITAFNHKNFGKNAKKIMVDIDKYEIDKMEMDIEVKVVCDVKDFIKGLNKSDKIVNISKQENKTKNKDWLKYCKDIRAKYPVVTNEHREEKDYVSAYYFIDKLCENLNSDDVIVPESSGGAGEITYQAFKIKKGQKMKNAAGLGSMGFGLPYAIGACLANDKRRTILINGDGAFQLNIQELETLKRLNLPVKIFIWNNNGYASIRAMQDNIFEGNYVACEDGCGLTMPSLSKIAQAYGIKTFTAKNNDEMIEILPKALNYEGPVLCELMVLPEETVSPRTKSIKLECGNMISKPLEDMWPFLSEDEIEENMR